MQFNKKIRVMAKQSLRESRRSILKLDDYKIPNIRYKKSYSAYKPKKPLH